VTVNGTLSLTYFDDRNNDPRDGIATTDIWLRHSQNAGATWEPEQNLSVGDVLGLPREASLVRVRVVWSGAAIVLRSRTAALGRG